MNIGDMVRVVDDPHGVDPKRTRPCPGGDQSYHVAFPGAAGIIIDSLELEDGFTQYEVMLTNGEIEWYYDLMIKPINTQSEMMLGENNE